MNIFANGFVTALNNAVESDIAPAWFFWAEPRDRETDDDVGIGFWSGDEDITITVQKPDGNNVSRLYLGNVGLEVDSLKQSIDLTDNPVNVTMSQIADAAEFFVRGYDPRMAYCEIHVTAMNGGAFTSNPQIVYIGIVDDITLTTGSSQSNGGITLVVRSEIMSMLLDINPTKSSHEHQRRRNPVDNFAEFASTVNNRRIQWYKE